MSRTMRKSGDGGLQISRFGVAGVACALSALLWMLVLAPAAHADTGPTLTDSGGNPTTTAAGHVVTLTAGVYAADGVGPTTVTDNWYDCTSSSPGQPPTAVGSLLPPTGCIAIAPTTPTTYLVKSTDVGSYITVFETDAAAFLAGTQTNQAVSNSFLVLPPPPPAPANSFAPSILGSSVVGSTLTAVSGGWNPPGAYPYTWQTCTLGHTNCSTAVNGPTYTLKNSDIGGYVFLTQTATATNAGGSTTATATSSGFGPITNVQLKVPPPAPPGAGTAVPTVSGTPQIGATLTGLTVAMSGNPTYTYQWLHCPGQSCTAIPGATAATYSPTAADLGDTLAFSQTGTNAGGNASAQSVKTAVVTAPTETTLQITPAGVVAGQTATLVATVTSATGQAPPMGAITFEQAGTAIPGCASIATKPSGASATVTCQTVFAGSAATLSAVFTPNPAAQVTGSDSTAVGFVLGRAATAATMSVPTNVTLGQRITFKARIAPQAGTKGVAPTGTVVFLDGTKAITGCSPALAAGIARCTVKYEALGSHSISAAYLGDGNFSGSSTHVHKLSVVVPKPTGFVSSLMTWTFHFKPRYTRVTTLTVTGVQPGLTISVRCSGSGCPKHRYLNTITRAACGKHDTCQNVNLAKHFSGRKLGVGARVTVRLTHPGWLGKYYAFVVRHGHKPKIDTACLAVGQAKPDAGCTPQ
jgi:Bacterial Ig-like domain (group 3)